MVTTSSHSNAPRTYFVPGIMSSQVGRVRLTGGVEVLWYDPLSVAVGAIADLALPGSAATTAAAGVIPLYSALALRRLRREGFDADYHPYDWRLGVDVLGQQLAARLAADPADEISLLAHSMGGLVSRAAMAQPGGEKIKRLVTLGTPHHGSFEPVQALTGTSRIVRAACALDVRHSTRELVARAVRTFPGLYDMLPAPSHFTTPNLRQQSNWPSVWPQPDPQLLKRIGHLQCWMPPPDPCRMRLVIGVGTTTVVDVQPRGPTWRFLSSQDGDGLVPRALAELPGVPTWYVRRPHGGLPLSLTVLSAAVDLLRVGTTSRLPTSPPHYG